MYKIKVNNQFEFAVSTNGVTGITTIDNLELNREFVKIRENLYHILIENKSITAEILSADYKSKEFKVKINNNIYTVEAGDKYDELLKKMGFDAKNNLKAGDLKAPMPGLVLDVKVTEGQKISKGDPVIVLEAMKMENILKAATDGVVKKVAVSKGNKVEKNDLLVVIS